MCTPKSLEKPYSPLDALRICINPWHVCILASWRFDKRYANLVWWNIRLLESKSWHEKCTSDRSELTIKDAIKLLLQGYQRRFWVCPIFSFKIFACLLDVNPRNTHSGLRSHLNKMLQGSSSHQRRGSAGKVWQSVDRTFLPYKVNILHILQKKIMRSFVIKTVSTGKRICSGRLSVLGMRFLNSRRQHMGMPVR